MTIATEEWFKIIEQRLDSSATRIDRIENLRTQLKGSSNMISNQLAQLTSALRLSFESQGHPSAKLAKLS
jgi:hypothetical protein